MFLHPSSFILPTEVVTTFAVRKGHLWPLAVTQGQSFVLDPNFNAVELLLSVMLPKCESPRTLTYPVTNPTFRLTILLKKSHALFTKYESHHIGPDRLPDRVKRRSVFVVRRDHILRQH